MKILYDPRLRTTEEIFSEEDQLRFFSNYEVLIINENNAQQQYSKWLPEADIIISQQALDRTRLENAKNLKAIFNLETNFPPDMDYTYCAARSIPVLTPSSVFALAVAKIGLAMALSLARNVYQAHADFQRGFENTGWRGVWVLNYSGVTVGILVYGDLGQAVHKVLAGFKNRILACDPWLPNGLLQRNNLEAVGLEELLRRSRFIFVTATITTKNTSLLNAERLEWMQRGAMLILLSRAAIADFDD